MAGADWTRDEVEATVADYFAMLDTELRGQCYSKAEHNRRLQERIGRSKGAIEFKHQNISAVLINFRQPFIEGYLPRQNYQMLLEQAVLEWLASHPRFFATLADGPVLAPTAKPELPPSDSLSALIEQPPPDVAEAADDARAMSAVRFYRLDFVRRDAENRAWAVSGRSGLSSSSSDGCTTTSDARIWLEGSSGSQVPAAMAPGMMSPRSMRTSRHA